MNLNKYVLAAMLSAGLLGTSMAQDKQKVETKEYESKVKTSKDGEETKIKYEDKKYEYKSKEEKNGEVKIKSEGDPTKFNQMNAASSAAPSLDTTTSATSKGIGSGADYKPAPTVEVINGTSETVQSAPVYTEEATTADSKNLSEKYKNDPSFNTTTSPAPAPATGSATQTPQEDKAATSTQTMPAGDYKYKSEAGGETKIKSGDDKYKSNANETKVKGADDSKYKSNANETKVKGADDSKYKSNANETKIKGADDSKLKVTDKEMKYKSGDDKTKVTTNKNETVIKTPEYKEKSEKDEYKYKSDSIKVKVKK